MDISDQPGVEQCSLHETGRVLVLEVNTVHHLLHQSQSDQSMFLISAKQLVCPSICSDGRHAYNVLSLVLLIFFTLNRTKHKNSVEKQVPLWW